MKFFLCSFNFLILLSISIGAHSQQSNDPYNGTKHPLFQKSFPLFSATAIDGKLIDSSVLEGKFLFIHFWYVGCVPCMEEISSLNKLYDKYRDSLVFISIATNSAHHLREFSDTAKLESKYNWIRRVMKYEVPRYPVIAGCALELNNEKYQVGPDCDSSLATFYSVHASPTTFLIDTNDIIRMIQIGAPHREEDPDFTFQQYDMLIRNLLEHSFH